MDPELQSLANQLEVIAWISTVAAVVCVLWAISLGLKLRKINRAIDQSEELIGRLEDS